MRRSIVTLSRSIGSDFPFNEAKCNFLTDLRRADAISRYAGEPQKRRGRMQSLSIPSSREESYRDELIEHRVILLNAELEFTRINPHY
jgi:hypothetical protein